MERGDITKRLAMIAELAMNGDDAQVQVTKNHMVMLIAAQEMLLPVCDIRLQVENDIGYLAGYLPVDLGNAALRLFHVEHPVFGAQIPEDMQHAMEMGQKLGKEWAIKKQTEAERAKKLAKSSDLGVMLPESDETVSNDDAARILKALKDRKGSITTALDPAALAHLGHVIKATPFEMMGHTPTAVIKDEDDHA